MNQEKNFDLLHKNMIAGQLRGRGITDPRVLESFGKVYRHEYVLPQYLGEAYSDTPLPIEAEQTISQPFIVALMMQLLSLQPADRVLEIGTGSGYQTALLAEMVERVVSIECIRELHTKAEEKLSQKYPDIICIYGDGYKGCPDFAPYDKIIVSAASPGVPKGWIDQLKEGGMIVVPLGDSYFQKLVKLEKNLDPTTQEVRMEESYICDVRFVPLVPKLR